jgi:glycosyltransferase involved in cell wall biosynthesis
VFADDWGRHPSSCQHLIRELLPRRSVTWVQTIGTRPLRFDRRTAARIWEKLGHWLRPQNESAGPRFFNSPTSPQILSPKMWPSFRSPWSRAINRRLLRSALRPVIEAMPQPPVVVTTLPLVADLIGELPAKRWIYYCVDDFRVWPGYDGQTMDQMEGDLLARVDAVVAVSETLQKRLAARGRSSALLTHGVELRRWVVPSGPTPPEFRGIVRPIVLFWGVIDRRLDLNWLQKLGQTLTAGKLVLVGPQEAPDPALISIPRLKILPPVSYERLPHLAAAADLLIMPYADLPVTRAMQPLKFKEYLATGKPVVARNLPSISDWADAADLCQNGQEFVDLVIRRLREGITIEQRQARYRLEGEGWDRKARQFEELMSS